MAKFTFRFYYAGIVYYDVPADFYSDALRVLSESTETVCGLHPLSFSDYDIL